MQLPLRVAVIGAARGRSFAHSAQHIPNKVRLEAVCDLREEALAPWGAQGVRCFTDYEQVLNDPNIDAVCIATPLKLHAAQAIAALGAGKHVLSEVTAAFTMQECWDLIRAVEASGLTYMMAENYCYMRDVMMVDEMVRQGVFGELIYAEGSYIHTVPELQFHEDGTLTWRGELRRDDYSNVYPTHSLGPVCQWLGINRTDRLKTTSTWQTKSASMPFYTQRMLKEDNPYRHKTDWRLPDSVTTMLRTENDVLIAHRFDCASPRPHNMHYYLLQGTHAAFNSNVDPGQEPLVWIADRSPTNQAGAAGAWEPLFKYADEFEHPLWRQSREEAAKAGHGGGDYFILREFTDAILEGRAPAIDVYDAVTWSSLTPLSAESMANNNCAVEVPDFKRQP